MAKQGNYRPWNKYFCDEDFFSRENEEAFYWAGFIAADGCVMIKNSKYSSLRVLEINLSAKDVDHLETFKQHIKAENPVNRYTTKDGFKKCRIKITSAKIFNDLNKFGIIPRKSLVIKFPKWLEKHHLVRHFMRGYYDGDGGYYIGKTDPKNLQMTMDICGTIQFLKVFKRIIEKKSNVKSIAQPFMKNNQGSLNYSGNVLCSAMSKFLYDDSTISLKRKYDLSQICKAMVKPRSLIVFPTKKELIKLYRETPSSEKVGKRIGLSQQTIVNLINKYNIRFLFKEAKLSGAWSRAQSTGLQPLNNDKEKYCPKCKEVKLHCEFSKCSTSIYGIDGYCTKCKRKREKESELKQKQLSEDK